MKVKPNEMEEILDANNIRYNKEATAKLKEANQ